MLVAHYPKKNTIFVRQNKYAMNKRKSRLFFPIKICLMCLLLALPVKAEEKLELSPFNKISIGDGLSDSVVVTLTQTADGDIVIRHAGSIDIMHNDEISTTPIPKEMALRIPNLHWARITRYDTDNNLWIKNPDTVMCFNMNTRKFVDISQKAYDDVFVDESHNLWTLKDSILAGSIKGKELKVDIHGKEKTLQAVDYADDKLLTFYNDGELLCYSTKDNQLLFRNRPYPEEEINNYNASFTLRKGTDGLYYMLRHNYHKCIFLSFNANTQEWRTIFETTDEIGFHCLDMPSEEIAVVGCSRGIWLIDVETGKMERIPSFILNDGSELVSGVNAVLQLKDGRFLIGTYGTGLLIADSLFAPESHKMQIIIFALLAVIVAGIILIVRYRINQKHKEEALMQRIHELMVQNDQPNEKEKEKEETQQINELSGRDIEILKQATALVKKNISLQGYNVDDLARDMAMERTGLYRHLNRIIQQSPSAFIRGIRMERAMELVKEHRLSITEISEQLGFSSVSYFSKCFKDYYGFTPSECKE